NQSIARRARSRLSPGGRPHQHGSPRRARCDPASGSPMAPGEIRREPRVKEAVRARALELGFDACHFASAAPPNSAPQFQAWLDAGRHGQMEWMARNAPKRTDPQLVLAGAKSIIVVAASYAGSEVQSSRFEVQGSKFQGTV